MTARDSVFEALRAVLTPLGCPTETISTLWGDLERRYSEPHRHYHRLEHIAFMLEGAKHVRTDDPALILAILYHDLIYDPSRPDNETQSAACLRAELGLWIAEAMTDHICAMIEATKSHHATGDDLTDLLLDLDMAILGAAWGDYQLYAEGVAREYIPVYGSDAYRAGRTEWFLKPVLAQPRIFLTPDFASLEAAARDNLRREIKLWEGGEFAIKIKP